MTDRLAAQVRAIVGDAHVLADPDACAGYGTDWTGRWSRTPRLVVRPGTTAETAAVVAACAEAGAPLVPQGGNTGLVGGSVPHSDEVVLALRRLAWLGAVDPAAEVVTVGAGATLAEVQDQAAGAGLDVGVDLASREQATIGGMVATNAGGIHTVAHGPMRAQLRGVEAVLADGRVLRRTGGLEADATGYDLPGLLAGSEGTLAVLTAVTVRLVPRPAHRVAALCALDRLDDAVALATRARGSLPGLVAAELVTADALALVGRHAGLAPPFDPPPQCVVLLEAAGAGDPTEALASLLDASPGVRDAAVGTDRPGRERLWRHREGVTEAIAAAGTPVKLDIALPLPEVAGFVAALPDLLPPGAAPVVFGHLAVGNLHVNVLGHAAGEIEGIEDAVLGEVVRRGGAVSAEHGVGVAKARWLPAVRDAADLDAAAAIRRALDPAGVLNPAVLRPHRRPVTGS